MNTTEKIKKFLTLLKDHKDIFGVVIFDEQKIIDSAFKGELPVQKAEELVKGLTLTIFKKGLESFTKILDTETDVKSITVYLKNGWIFFIAHYGNIYLGILAKREEVIPKIVKKYLEEIERILAE